jgi:hypothetical protein
MRRLLRFPIAFLALFTALLTFGLNWVVSLFATTIVIVLASLLMWITKAKTPSLSLRLESLNNWLLGRRKGQGRKRGISPIPARKLLRKRG